MPSFCSHGRSFSASEFQKKQLIREWVAWQRKTEEITGPCHQASPLCSSDFDSFFAYWTEQAELVDEELYKLCFAEAASALVKSKKNPDLENYARMYADQARMFAENGIHLKRMAMKGVHEFMRETDQTGLTEAHIKSVRKIHSRKGLVQCIARNIPCSCLEDLLDHYRKLGTCCYCGTDHVKVTEYHCSRCEQQMEFCSKSCRKAQWLSHKRFCGGAAEKFPSRRQPSSPRTVMDW